MLQPTYIIKSSKKPRIDSKFYLKLAIYNNMPRFIILHKH